MDVENHVVCPWMKQSHHWLTLTLLTLKCHHVGHKRKTLQYYNLTKMMLNFHYSDINHLHGLDFFFNENVKKAANQNRLFLLLPQSVFTTGCLCRFCPSWELMTTFQIKSMLRCQLKWLNYVQHILSSSDYFSQMKKQIYCQKKWQ